MHWVFAFLERMPASIDGWERRFWQGSHDHRGTPENPGRVVTLLPAEGRTCAGMAYCIDESVFEHLDHREKNGYQRRDTGMQLADGRHVLGTVYVADQHNHAYMGEAPLVELAELIAGSHGPSGSNRDYLLRLAEALRELTIEDEHVFALEDLLRKDFLK